MELMVPDFLKHATRCGYTPTELMCFIANLYTSSEDFPSSITEKMAFVLAVENGRIASYMTTNYRVFCEIADDLPFVRADVLMKHITH